MGARGEGKRALCGLTDLERRVQRWRASPGLPLRRWKVLHSPSRRVCPPVVSKECKRWNRQLKVDDSAGSRFDRGIRTLTRSSVQGSDMHAIDSFRCRALPPHMPPLRRSSLSLLSPHLDHHLALNFNLLFLL